MTICRTHLNFIKLFNNSKLLSIINLKSSQKIGLI